MWDKNMQAESVESGIVKKIGKLGLEVLDNKSVKERLATTFIPILVKNVKNKLIFELW